MDNGAYGGAPYRLPEKFGLADTIGRKPRCEVGVFIFGQPGFHNAAAVGCVVFLSHGRDLLSCRMSAAGISGASRIAGFGEGTPQQVSREGQNRRIADFGTVVETCSKKVAAFSVLSVLCFSQTHKRKIRQLARQSFFTTTTAAVGCLSKEDLDF